MTVEITKADQRAPRNQTLSLSSAERSYYQEKLIKLTPESSLDQIINRTINQDLFEALDKLPLAFVDLLFIDPPYNLTKKFNGAVFEGRSIAEYTEWLESFLPLLLRVLKPTASVYICGDWRSAAAIQTVCEKYLIIRNRITWEREKGRGAKRNWKNCSEDIWFCTQSHDYYFDVGAVKIKRRVIAPYKDSQGRPKDWQEGEDGKHRLTHPSNIWTDLTIPFWSMPENTDHPTQKPEKMLAKIVLASSRPGDLILDPFLGVGTTSVVAKKLQRNYVGIEMDTYFSCLAEKRLELAETDRTIQGYSEGIFWERNSL